MSNLHDVLFPSNAVPSGATTDCHTSVMLIHEYRLQAVTSHSELIGHSRDTLQYIYTGETVDC